MLPSIRSPRAAGEGGKWTGRRHRHASESHDLAKWTQTPRYTIFIQTQFPVESEFARVMVWAQSSRSQSSKRPGHLGQTLTQLKSQVFSKQRPKHEFYLGWFLFQIEKLHKERTNIHFHDRREKERASYCVTLLMQQTISTWTTGPSSPQAGRENFNTEESPTQ